MDPQQAAVRLLMTEVSGQNCIILISAILWTSLVIFWEIIKDIKTAIERNGEESGVYSVLRENKGLAFGLGLGLFVSPLTVLGGLVAGDIVNKTVEVYDEEVIYWSTGRIEKNKINIRHQNLLGNEI